MSTTYFNMCNNSPSLEGVEDDVPCFFFRTKTWQLYEQKVAAWEHGLTKNIDASRVTFGQSMPCKLQDFEILARKKNKAYI